MGAIRIAVVDDSIFVRKALNRILDADSRVEVVGTAASGEELLEHLDEWRPDLISLDLSMPGMGGLRTLDEIMVRRPTPVIVLSTLAKESAPLTIEALHRGAVDFIDKQQFSMVDFASISRVLLERILNIVEPPEPLAADARAAGPIEPTARPSAVPAAGDADQLLLIGASTGGPMAIQTVLESLTDDFAPPVIVVQHMPVGFTTAFAERLNSRLPFTVREAQAGEAITSGTVLLAPGGRHLTLEKSTSRLCAQLSEPDDASLHCPSVDRLFLSAAELGGDRVIAVLLTGMGSDGAHGMAALARAGAHTLVQDEPTSIVFGMPRAAIEKRAAREVLPLEQIGSRIVELCDREPDT